MQHRADIPVRKSDPFRGMVAIRLRIFQENGDTSPFPCETCVLERLRDSLAARESLVVAGKEQIITEERWVPADQSREIMPATRFDHAEEVAKPRRVKEFGMIPKPTCIELVGWSRVAAGNMVEVGVAIIARQFW